MSAVPPFVHELGASFRRQVRRALDVDLDGSETSLAFVDHYLSLAAAEKRLPILLLLAAEAGAYYGEIVRETFGGYWAGDEHEPRRLKLLLRPQFVYFYPVDQALASLTLRFETQETSADDPVDDLDPSFHLLPPTGPRLSDAVQRLAADASWLEERLSELPPVDNDTFYSLTGRFETLKLMVELLAHKQQHDGRPPRMVEVADYTAVLGEAS